MDGRSPSKRSRHEESGSSKMRGVVVLMKKKVLGVNDIAASVVDRVDEIRGKVALQLISSTAALDHDSGVCVCVCVCVYVCSI
ncbi:UNVERIFIED_CONTAM: hypothetical protein Slati_0847200 [Sesamum latifolium]|uniref:Uncharacterized protein n=1 Tax=Sesamum latifolium TaxID=2727402 RepID=A0AAW2XM48_9LAMI